MFLLFFFGSVSTAYLLFCTKFVNTSELTQPMAFFAVIFSADDFRQNALDSLLVATKSNPTSTNFYIPMDLKVESIEEVEDMLKHSKLTEKSDDTSM